MNRRYQRKLVWTLEEKQKLVNSLLANFPVPAIILAEVPGDPETYEIIDGLQRLHAIMSFVETAFPTEDGKFFDLEKFPTALNLMKEGRFEDGSGEKKISAGEATRILDYSLATAIMRNATDDEINEVFGRINTYGHRLSNQERRQAGNISTFSESVRSIASSLRGDVSNDTLPLHDMPSISVDMPMSKHGYEIQAENVFWVKHGVILAGDLRDSQDEECVADILASMALSDPINRSKKTLDAVYNSESDEAKRITAALDAKGADRAVEEFKFIIGEIEKLAADGGDRPLNRRLFSKVQGNAFPTIFATLFLGIYELVVGGGKRVADYHGVAAALENCADKLDAGKKGAVQEQRRQNINLVKGIIQDYFVEDEKIAEKIFQDHGIVHIDDAIKRSQIELANYELKSGFLPLYPNQDNPNAMFEKISKTLCAISDLGPDRVGKIIIGVADSDVDVQRVKEMDNIEGRKVGSRVVVGVNREAKRLGITVEQYIHKLRDFIAKSPLSSPLRENVLGHMDYNDYFGLGVVILAVGGQKKPSFYGEDIYYREGDQTKKGRRSVEGN